MSICAGVCRMERPDLSTTKQRAGWQPRKLRERRESHGLSLEAAGDKLRQVAERGGLRVAANFQTLWEHENGNMYPGPHYRRAYCLMYEATEPELGFRLPSRPRSPETSPSPCRARSAPQPPRTPPRRSPRGWTGCPTRPRARTLPPATP